MVNIDILLLLLILTSSKKYKFPISILISNVKINMSRSLQIYMILNLIVLMFHCFPTSHRLNTPRYKTQSFHIAKVFSWIIDGGLNNVAKHFVRKVHRIIMSHICRGYINDGSVFL